MSYDFAPATMHSYGPSNLRRPSVVMVAPCLAMLLHTFATVCAQQLPFRHYDTSDGIVGSRVTVIYQDVKGYLWFGTTEGLSRFDGYRFVNYGTHNGLVNPSINTITEDRQGRLWVGTNGGGVAQLAEDLVGVASDVSFAGQKKFISYAVGNSQYSNRVNGMLFDGSDTLWCATDLGLYRSSFKRPGELVFEVVVSHQPAAQIMATYGDAQGHLWFGMQSDLVEVVGGRAVRHGIPTGPGHLEITAIAEDRQGRLLVSFGFSIFEFVRPDGPGERSHWRDFPLALAPGQKVYSIVNDKNGSLWIGTRFGLLKLDTHGWTTYTIAQGLSDNSVYSLREDRQGNLWIGTLTGGASKLLDYDIISYTVAEGLPEPVVTKVIEARDGRIYADTSHSGVVEIVNGRAVPISGSRPPPSIFYGNYRQIVQDRQAHWWVATSEGLFRLDGQELQFRRRKKYPMPSQSAGASIVGEDQSGSLLVSTNDDNLYRFDPLHPSSFERISSAATRVMSDRSGTLWIARWDDFCRLKEGKITVLPANDDFPETGRIRALFEDSRGWLWIGHSSKGAYVTKDPGSEQPHFMNFSTQNGLASANINSITEDDSGRIYLGTTRGLDQIDPLSGRVRHLTTLDGLAGNVVYDSIKDRHGQIWVATNAGLSKFHPALVSIHERPPSIYLSRVQVAGEDLALPERGVSSVREIILPASRNNLVIEYVGLESQREQALKYQYRLEGVDAGWSAPTEQRIVNYARLAPGSYRFLVRALTGQGTESKEPAVLAFRILPPIWQRWWFLVLATLGIVLVAYVTHRRRVARLVELERVRTRIATDLHDDIGSNLSQIALLSEVVRQQTERLNPQASERLSLIANISRKSVDAMADIVWSINPKRDQVGDLVQRMRLFASDVFTARDVKFSFNATGAERQVRLGVDVRRQIYLIFKESINNTVRHSKCTRAEVEFKVDSGWLVLKISDNGTGFENNQTGDGHGLASMHRRAKDLGGSIDVTSSEGTTVTLKVPLGHF